jgi:hypothetical protein
VVTALVCAAASTDKENAFKPITDRDYTDKWLGLGSNASGRIQKVFAAVEELVGCASLMI